MTITGMELNNVTDVHTHYLPAALVEALASRQDMPRIAQRGERREIQYGPGNGHELYPVMTDIAGQLEAMDRSSVQAALINANVPGVDWFPASEAVAVARAANDELAQVSRDSDGRLAATALLPMVDPPAAAAELERAAGIGLRGGMIFSNIAGERLDSGAYEAIFSTATEIGMPILIHPTFPLSAKTMDAYALIPTLGFLVDTTTAILRLILGGIYERHPELMIYLPHSGSLLPQLAGRIDNEAARMPGGMGHLSAPPSEHLRRIYTDCVCDWPAALRSCLELLGAERVMFGSDFPFWQRETALETVAGTGLSDTELEQIRTGTAARLFRIGSGG